MIVGYTSGVFDLLHYGHYNLLQNARKLCDVLIVGVNSDKLCKEYKNKKPVMNEEERLKTIRALHLADICLITAENDRVKLWRKLKFDVLIVGDDWYGDKRWMEYERRLKGAGVKTIFLPYTKDVSTTKLRREI